MWMELIFWFSFAFVAYVYAGYPLVLQLWARARKGDGTGSDRQQAAALPGVSIVLAAHNEAARLGARLENLRSLDYPPARRQIIVVSDGSTDETADVARRHSPFVDYLEVPRGGKALALNAGVLRAKFEIVVFADARQTFAADALRRLVAPFSDPTVGGVTGELLLDCESALFGNRRGMADRRREKAGQAPPGTERRFLTSRRLALESSIADGVGLYWRYEKLLRRLESTIGSTLGATGAIYAIRRTLWKPLPADTILDDVLAPMRVVMAGFRVVFEERARAFDRAAADGDAESRRKIRTLAGNFQILWLEPRLLVPGRNPVWFQYLSHKVGRLLVPYALLTAFFATAALAQGSLFYQVLLAGQVAFLALAGYGAVLERRIRMPAPPMHDDLGVPARGPA
jgi:cellulose synthase/poly-beta-1,6-N-acetylglucosamine synthase-like glycosyltransferase